jgi:GrpB-like predicted nucleotidyltransferase (UPF0157 family)
VLADASAALRAALDDRTVRIDHIGSTAIPDMPAKDVIDLQMSVDDLDRAEGELAEPLASLGFTLSPHRSDHAPAGWSGDRAVWAKRLWVRRDSPSGDVNLHVRGSGSPNERVALLFRDWFRTHPEAVPAYGEFKRALATVCPDVDTYATAKDPVVDLVITVAERWATDSGWRPD